MNGGVRAVDFDASIHVQCVVVRVNAHYLEYKELTRSQIKSKDIGVQTHSHTRETNRDVDHDRARELEEVKHNVMKELISKFANYLSRLQGHLICTQMSPILKFASGL